MRKRASLLLLAFLLTTAPGCGAIAEFIVDVAFNSIEDGKSTAERSRRREERRRKRLGPDVFPDAKLRSGGR